MSAPLIRDAAGNYIPSATITGSDGREVELRATSTHIQWRYPDTEWANIVALSSLIGPQGDPGAEVEMRVNAGIFQYRVGTTGDWSNLIGVNVEWFFGTAISGTGSGISATIDGSKAGDIYANTSTGETFQCVSTGVWDYKYNTIGGIPLLPAATPTDLPLVSDANRGAQTKTAAEMRAILGAQATLTPGTDYAIPAVDIAATLSTTWTGSAAPYTQSVDISGMTAEKKIQVGLAASCTAAQYAAAEKAKLLCTAQSAGAITITAFGTKPTAAIPILVRVVG